MVASCHFLSIHWKNDNKFIIGMNLLFESDIEPFLPLRLTWCTGPSAFKQSKATSQGSHTGNLGWKNRGTSCACDIQYIYIYLLYIYIIYVYLYYISANAWGHCKAKLVEDEHCETQLNHGAVHHITLRSLRPIDFTIFRPPPRTFDT